MKSKVLTLLAGMLIGALLLGGAAIATEMVVLPTTATVLVDGVEKDVAAFNIDGSNYFKLRDFTAAVDIGVWFDGENNTIHIETDKAYDANYAGPDGTEDSVQGATEPEATAGTNGEADASDPTEAADPTAASDPTAATDPTEAPE